MAPNPHQLRTPPGRRARRLGVAVAAAALVGALGAPADAASTSHLHTIDMGYGDFIYNFDFNSSTVSSTNVDWAVSMLFTNNANINKVKDVISSTYDSVGSEQSARLNDGAGYVWDTDGGKKTGWCSYYGGQTNHIRFYADSDDRMYNTRYGYYIFATTHIDHQECTPDDWYGDSETTETSVANIFANKGYAVQRNSLWLDNQELNRVEGDHHWNNNGYATVVNVP